MQKKASDTKQTKAISSTSKVNCGVWNKTRQNHTGIDPFRVFLGRSGAGIGTNDADTGMAACGERREQGMRPTSIKMRPSKHHIEAAIEWAAPDSLTQAMLRSNNACECINTMGAPADSMIRVFSIHL